jgi:periplasmic glucans biosynthesis protein
MSAGLSALAAALAHSGFAQTSGTTDSMDFSWEWLNEHARDLARKPFNAAGYEIPKELADLDYDHYRFIKYKAEKAIWYGEPVDYQLQLFHLGYIYRDPVNVFIVENGKATPLHYDKSLFHFGPAEKRAMIPDNIGGFSGLRIHGPIEQPGVFEEYLVFQGASYFRGKPKLQNYGLSARGLAINTAQPEGEEFPSFRAFWAVKPKPGDAAVTLYALLDGISVTGAYRIMCSGPSDVVMDIECQLYPRRTLAHAGIAPFSSMFFYGPADHTPQDDFRPQVHDSDGLAVLTSYGEWLWRPLVTARNIQYSMFLGGTPGGFGLIQRARDYHHYEDLNASYEKRPSTWVQPLNDWGKGSVDLVELPTNGEFDDNIVAFWRPETPLEPGQSYNYRYRLTWAADIPVKQDVARVVQTRSGKGIKPGGRFLVVDFAGGPVYADADDEAWDYLVTASAGYIKAYTVGPNAVIDGIRVGIEYYPDGDKVADLKFQINSFGKPLTERWVYRWTP